MWTKVVARAQGQVAADALEAFRRAGAAVHATLADLDGRHHERVDAERSPWAMDGGARAERLCAWNAFVLQTIGDCLLEADYAADPATAGYVPPALAKQALAVYGQVEAWVTRAYQARCNPTYILDVAVPALLPPWSASRQAAGDGPVRGEARGLLQAVQRVGERADTLLVDALRPDDTLAAVETALAPDARERALGQLRHVSGEARAKAEYASRLWAQDAPQRVRVNVVRAAREALEAYYLFGQLASMPVLAAHPPAEAAPSVSSAAKTPARRGARTSPAVDFSGLWRLTDPDARAYWRGNPAARKAIETLWRSDPDPSRTLALQEELEAALARGDIAYATDTAGERIGHYYACPWAPIYVAKRPVEIAGQRVETLQQFTLDVFAGNTRYGGEFVRRLLVAQFGPTAEVRYRPLRKKNGERKG